MAKLGDREMPLEEKQALLKEAAIIQAGLVYHYKLICRAVGIKAEETLKDWRDADPDFSDRLEKARTEFLTKRIKASKPEFLLERLEPDIFKQRTETEQNGNIGVTLSAEQAEQLIRARANRSNP